MAMDYIIVIYHHCRDRRWHDIIPYLETITFILLALYILARLIFRGYPTCIIGQKGKWRLLTVSRSV